MKIIKSFDYTSASDSARPGYLQRKFAKIRAEQKAEAEAAEKRAEEAKSKVKQLKSGKGAT